MPKKHQRFHTKPASPAHHSLGSSSRHDKPGASVAAESVNDLISHLRLTQTRNSSEDGGPRPRPSQRSLVSPRSVHPSLRNLLELPETPPPRPRPGAQRTAIGTRPRRTAGPPPPESWLAGNTDGSNGIDQHRFADMAGDSKRVVHRLKRLPGVAFPDQRDLLHMVLKSMALNWLWHLEYDGPFLSQLPGRIKTLLLSYVAVYGRGLQLKGRMKGLKPLLLTEDDYVQDDEHGDDSNASTILASDAAISRLDLGNALGHWMTFKQLTSELFTSTKPNLEREGVVPGSWDEEIDQDKRELISPDSVSTSSVPKSMTQGLRFTSLRYLSLAHPQLASASWNSLLNLLNRLSTLTHLSLAHWPTPTRTPGAATARIRHPLHHSLTFSYSGTDNYAAMENNWAEAATILRQLSRSTYCLKWLDLEGCAEWLPALKWVGKDPDGHPYPLGASGPEWNGSWRDVEWINVGPGWVPDLSDDSESLEPQSLAMSISPPDDADDYDSASRHEERLVNFRRENELKLYRDSVQTSLEVRTHVRQIRKEGRGKWPQVSFGLEDVDSETVKTLLGREISVVL
ncbi:hypothetical protein PENANT_c019G08008 [Penicillium antarcticum]|uniref:Tafazzin n=1 Tax=Penicillium antarcticum TaxID=416450 RepID=A0A1V6Q0K9_9EURO|nr:hypothetical protein PENANT_c019G08008 [Penicillium antarcticum]